MRPPLLVCEDGTRDTTISDEEAKFLDLLNIIFLLLCILLYSNGFLFVITCSAASLIASFSKNLLVAGQREPVVDVISLDSLYSLLASLLTNIKGLNHGLDVILAG